MLSQLLGQRGSALSHGTFIEPSMRSSTSAASVADSISHSSLIAYRSSATGLPVKPTLFRNSAGSSTIGGDVEGSSAIPARSTHIRR